MHVFCPRMSLLRLRASHTYFLFFLFSSLPYFTTSRLASSCLLGWDREDRGYRSRKRRSRTCCEDIPGIVGDGFLNNSENIGLLSIYIQVFPCSSINHVPHHSYLYFSTQQCAPPIITITPSTNKITVRLQLRNTRDILTD